MSIGERIKARRKQLGMSADTLAELIGKSPATVYRYENGDISGVDSRVLLPIADALHTSPAYLMGWDEISDNLGSDSPASKHLYEISDKFKSPMIEAMNRAMQRMTLKEQQKMVDVGKALFPNRFIEQQEGSTDGEE